MVALLLNGRLICGTDIIQGFTLYCHWPSRNPSSDRTTNFGVIINIVGRHNQASWICFFLVFGWTTKTPGCEEVFRGLFPTNVTICLLLGFRNTVGSFLLPLLLHPPSPASSSSTHAPRSFWSQPTCGPPRANQGSVFSAISDASLTQDKKNPEFFLFIMQIQ